MAFSSRTGQAVRAGSRAGLPKCPGGVDQESEGGAAGYDLTGWQNATGLDRSSSAVNRSEWAFDAHTAVITKVSPVTPA